MQTVEACPTCIMTYALLLLRVLAGGLGRGWQRREPTLTEPCSLWQKCINSADSGADATSDEDNITTQQLLKCDAQRSTVLQKDLPDRRLESVLVKYASRGNRDEVCHRQPGPTLEILDYVGLAREDGGLRAFAY